MSAAKEIKALGLKSLQYVADNSDTKRGTLNHWYHHNYERFITIAEGVKARKDKGIIK